MPGPFLLSGLFVDGAAAPGAGLQGFGTGKADVPEQVVVEFQHVGEGPAAGGATEKGRERVAHELCPDVKNVEAAYV